VFLTRKIFFCKIPTSLPFRIQLLLPPTHNAVDVCLETAGVVLDFVWHPCRAATSLAAYGTEVPLMVKEPSPEAAAPAWRLYLVLQHECSEGAFVCGCLLKLVSPPIAMSAILARVHVISALGETCCPLSWCRLSGTPGRHWRQQKGPKTVRGLDAVDHSRGLAALGCCSCVGNNSGSN